MRAVAAAGAFGDSGGVGSDGVVGYLLLSQRERGSETCQVMER